MNFKKIEKITFLFVLSAFIPVNPWLLILPSPCFADDDALAAPTPAESGLKGVQPKARAQMKPPTETEPADVVGQNGETGPDTGEAAPAGPAVTPVGTSPTPPLALTPTPTPTKTPKPGRKTKATPTPRGTRTPSPVPTDGLPRVTTIPNPAYGDKVIFRVMTPGEARARIVVYDRFFSRVKELQGEGDRLFDLLWNLKKVPEGIYYYQSEVTDSGTGKTKMLQMQSFAVMRDGADPDGD